MALAAASAFALDTFDFTSSREKSMGGEHAALADDFSVILSNPAGLADAPRQFSAADLSFQAEGPVFDIANLLLGGSPSVSGITNFLAQNDDRVHAGAEISGPFAFGYTGGGLGFGLFNKTHLVLDIANVNSIDLSAGEDLLLTGGYAMRFDLGKGHELAAGMSAKGFVRGAIEPSMGITQLYDYASGASSPMSLLGDTFTLTTGIGIDAGIRWSWDGQVAAGLVCHDVYSPAIVSQYSSLMGFLSNPGSSSEGAPTYDSLDRKLDFGLMYKPRLGRLGDVIDSLTLAADYNDILDLWSPVPRNAILNVSLGMEVRVLGIVTLRAGVDEALLSAGIGLDLGIFTLSLAAYGSELGIEPGDQPYYNLLVDFAFKY
jgi:hypothetical protein